LVLADRWIFHHFAYGGVYDRAWGRMLRTGGYLPFWGVAALGLPSSEAAVAFGAAVMARLFPEARGLWYGIALGCALTRVAARAHFMSDVVLAALVVYVVMLILWRWWPTADTESGSDTAGVTVGCRFAYHTGVSVGMTMRRRGRSAATSWRWRCSRSGAGVPDPRVCH
jgi:membrane-associated phospholipid phosphatase